MTGKKDLYGMRINECGKAWWNRLIIEGDRERPSSGDKSRRTIEDAIRANKSKGDRR